MSFSQRHIEAVFCGCLLACLGCGGGSDVGERAVNKDGGAPGYAIQREQMVRDQLLTRDIHDPRVLKAMRQVQRHLFVPVNEAPYAYEDRPLPIGDGQTISQPYIVALMSQLLELQGGEKVLEVGTGSGYQAAVLAALDAHVFSIEIICQLADRARERLHDLGIMNVNVRCGDGYRGWPEAVPFDAIIVTAAPDHVPPPLIEQLKDGGRLVIPVGEYHQELVLIRKEGTRTIERKITPVRFVPMTGEVEERPR